MKTAFLFPGQGSQKEGMLRSMPLSDPHVREVFADTEEIMKISVGSLDTEEKLSSTAFVQVCLLVAGVICGKWAKEKKIKADYVAGHSAGSFAAAVTSGVLSFKQALSLIYKRGLLMQQAYPIGYGMAAFSGFSESRMQKYINEHNQVHSTVYMANVNTADQQVVTGDLKSIGVFTDTLIFAGIRKAKILNVTVPSHCELLNNVSLALKEQLADLIIQEPLIPYASNHTGRILKTAEAIREDLWKNIAHTVRWYDATSLMYELGARIFIEMEPAGVLAKMTESSFPDAKVIPMQENKIEPVAWLWNNWQAEHIS